MFAERELLDHFPGNGIGKCGLVDDAAKNIAPLPAGAFQGFAPRHCRQFRPAASQAKPSCNGTVRNLARGNRARRKSSSAFWPASVARPRRSRAKNIVPNRAAPSSARRGQVDRFGKIKPRLATVASCFALAAPPSPATSPFSDSEQARTAPTAKQRASPRRRKIHSVDCLRTLRVSLDGAVKDRGETMRNRPCRRDDRKHQPSPCRANMSAPIRRRGGIAGSSRLVTERRGGSAEVRRRIIRGMASQPISDQTQSQSLSG